ncbi:MAG: tripartite tricarboxylate transporter substrate binding protein, partial [Rhodospirillaceae bacterium]|nr:tripartite tricarboxylate transporter substrate binding protein [Rhodospirillaceae bacterium]
MYKLTKWTTAAVAAMAVTAAAIPAGGPPNTARPDTRVEPNGPGGAAGQAAPHVAGTAPKYLNHAVLAINKAGAAGSIGAFHVVRAKKDGYTLLSARVGSNAGVPAFNPSIPYKWDQFTFLGLTERNPFVLVVNAKSDIKTFKDFEAGIKAGKIKTYSSAGVGTLLH